jgi:hypothetical protein
MSEKVFDVIVLESDELKDFAVFSRNAVEYFGLPERLHLTGAMRFIV